ncbi:MAG: hypothetical protein GDA51_03840 [Ekhidna sp.]|nr:hypothetical protein [Ekhidna sp.]MBC6425599.1 hypothetical protein [Ekhidna sp.]
MNYFDSIYSRLFGGKSNPPGINVDGLIRRSENFLGRFERWKTSERCQDFLSEIWESYFWRRRGIDKNPALVLFELSNSNGFAINYSPEFDQHSFHFLLDHFADQVKKLGYRLVTSRSSLRDKGDYVEKKEMHYLKPKRDFSEPIDQKFGNVQIEYIEKNNEPSRIKLIASSYPDRKYKEAMSFESLAEHVLTLSSK